MLLAPPPVILGGPVSLEFMEMRDRSATWTTLNITGVDFGAAKSKREIVMSAMVQFTTNARTISTITIGGVTHQLHSYEAVGTSGGTGYMLVSAPVPTGATGDISITMSGECGISFFSFYRVVNRVGFGTSGVYDEVREVNSGLGAKSTTAVDYPRKSMGFSVCRTTGASGQAAVSGSGYVRDSGDGVGGVYYDFASAQPKESADNGPTTTWDWPGTATGGSSVWWSIL